MNYYHVRIVLFAQGKNRPEEFFDLDKTDLFEIKDKVIFPYLKKEKFFFKSKFVEYAEIDKIKITETDKTSRQLSDAAYAKQTGFIDLTDSCANYRVAFYDSYSKDLTAKLIEEVQATLSTSPKVEKPLDDLESRLHKSIKTVAYQKYLDGYFAEAVESACKEINERLKKLYKKLKVVEKDGKDLFAAVFNDKETDTLLKVDNLNSQSGKDEQAGYRFLLMGMWSALRNPKAHANLTLTQDEAYDRLIFISMLMKRIDKAVDYSFKE